jgi:hypothetical protein
MSKTFVFNTSDGPVLANTDGRTIGGGEWGWAEGTPLSTGLDTGLLVPVKKPGKDASPEAVAAYNSEKEQG